MRIDKLTLRGFTTFKEEQSLVFESLGPGLIAIVGPNGAGKTTLLESIPGAIWRTSPSRGNIANLANARDAHIELIGENGSPFTIRLDVDAHTGKSEAVLLDGAGEPLAGPKVRDFDRAIAEKFPAYNVYMAASFACQTGAGSLLKMDRSDRRELFGRLLGLDRLEDLATAARERGRQAENDLVAGRAALEAIKDGAGDVKALTASLNEAKANAETAKAEEKAADDKFRAAQAELDRLQFLQDSVKDIALKALEAKLKAEAAQKTVDDLEAQEQALWPILSKADAIRAEAAVLRSTQAEFTSIQEKVRAAETEARRARARADEATKKAGDARKAEVELKTKIEALEHILAEGPAIRKQALELQSLMVECDRIREEGERASAAEREAVEAMNEAGRIATQEAQKLKNADRAIADAVEKKAKAAKRIERAALSTGTVPCAGSLTDEQRRGCVALLGHFEAKEEAEIEIAEIESGEYAREAALRVAREASEKWEAEHGRLSIALKAAGEKTAKIRLQYRTTKDRADNLRAVDRSAALAKAEAEAGALKPALEAATKAAIDAQATAEVDLTFWTSAGKNHSEFNYQAVTLEMKVKAHEGADLRLAELEKDEREDATIRGRLESAKPAAKTAAEEAAKAQAAVVLVDPEKILDATADMEEADSAAEVAALTANNATYKAAQIEADLNAAIESQRKAEELKAKIAPLEQDAAEYRFLSRGLGREGVQALELDAAGPQVSTLANELLADAYGSRFQIRFETQAALANGKGVKETFDIVVCDTERGREGNGEDLSGGEKVIVGEALGLAVGLFHAQAAGVSLGTVIRDETVGALDPENGEKYLAMLRAFLRVGKVHQLLFVCHNPQLSDLADAVVRVENGRIESN